jgi:hypothetical protein
LFSGWLFVPPEREGKKSEGKEEKGTIQDIGEATGERCAGATIDYRSVR